MNILSVISLCLLAIADSYIIPKLSQPNYINANKSKCTSDMNKMYGLRKSKGIKSASSSLSSGLINESVAIASSIVPLQELNGYKSTIPDSVVWITLIGFVYYAQFKIFKILASL